jgi:ribose transport system ATP-binding protein
MLEARAITKSFSGVKALRSVDLELRPGEVVGLVGENGAGKSTLMRVLGGTHQPDEGEIRIDGSPVRLRNAREAAENGVAMVFQEQSLLLNLSVAENIYLGRDSQFVRYGVMNWRALRRAARRQLEKIGVDIDVARRAADLSFAARQMVELAKALTLEESTRQALHVLLDEPTSVLNASEVETLFKRIRALRSRASFVFVSHRLDEVLHISDRIYVMKDGAVVAEPDAAGTSPAALHELMVGRGVQSEYYLEARQRPPRERVLIEAQSLGSRGAFENVSFQIRAGEVVAIAGVVGSGREEVTRCLAGFHPHSAGELRVEDEKVRFTQPRQAVARGVGYVPRERRVEGLVMYLSIATNITLARLDKVTRNGAIRHRAEAGLARSWIERLRIKAPGPDALCLNLSGGNQQKVVLARWMTAGSKVMILDHPTRGLDVGAKEEVYALIRDLCAEGVGVLLISDTLEETIGLAHHILVMRDGRVTGRFEAAQGRKPDQVDLVRMMV